MHMSKITIKKDSDQDLPPLPAKDASPEEWRRYHEALYKAGKLTPPDPNKK